MSLGARLEAATINLRRENVRKLSAIAALAALGVSTAAAQSSWTAELGIQGGFAKIKPAGTKANDALTLFDVPGGSFLFSTLGSGALYAIIPWHNKLAAEVQLGGSQLQAGTTAYTVARIGLRADYALSPQFYAAAGGVLNYTSGLTPKARQLGLQAAVGYRRRLTNTINGRLEANMTATDKKGVGPLDVYAVQVGISSSIGGGKTAAASRRGNNRAWEPAIGIAGGYASMHIVGSTSSISGMFFPGVGGDLIALAPIAAAPTMFVIIPMGQKLALEPGVDFHSVATPGTTIKSINVAARFDYAVSDSWYGAAGGHLLDVSRSGSTSGTANGLDFAWGYRFHLAGAFGGRFEGNYSLTAKSTKLGLPPINTLSLTFGATMPLK
jgi:hypothetical protein